jgi:pimeloyl-ACP methyl ester carboxylesterase
MTTRRVLISGGDVRSHQLLLLHGQPGSAADWRRVHARLPAQLQAVAVDRPGYGSSRRAPAGFAGNARAVVDELDARSISEAVLVGHSYGGAVALSAAILAPDRVEALVLLASAGPGCLNAVDRLMAGRGTGPLCAMIAVALTPWIPPGDHHPRWRTFLAEQRALVQEVDQLTSLLPRIQVPVLLLADPRDLVVPVATARRLEQALPEARLQLIRGSGHDLPRRAPGRVANAIAGFLAALDADHSSAGQGSG